MIISLAVALISMPTIAAAQVNPQSGTVGYNAIQSIIDPVAEYRVNIGRGIKAFSVQPRGDCDLRIAFAAGGTTSNYRTIKYLTSPVYYSPSIVWDGIFYLRLNESSALCICNPSSAQVVEIEYWR
jgi:hypothetical protein